MIDQIEREIIQAVSGSWDAIFHDAATNEFTIRRVFFVAVARRFYVDRSQLKKRRWVTDEILPYDPNDWDFDGFISDREGYVGMVPAGADWRDPFFEIEIPTANERGIA